MSCPPTCVPPNTCNTADGTCTCRHDTSPCIPPCVCDNTGTCSDTNDNPCNCNLACTAPEVCSFIAGTPQCVTISNCQDNSTCLGTCENNHCTCTGGTLCPSPGVCIGTSCFCGSNLPCLNGETCSSEGECVCPSSCTCTMECQTMFNQRVMELGVLFSSQNSNGSGGSANISNNPIMIDALLQSFIALKQYFAGLTDSNTPCQGTFAKALNDELGITTYNGLVLNQISINDLADFSTWVQKGQNDPVWLYFSVNCPGFETSTCLTQCDNSNTSAATFNSILTNLINWDTKAFDYKQFQADSLNFLNDTKITDGYLTAFQKVLNGCYMTSNGCITLASTTDLPTMLNINTGSGTIGGDLISFANVISTKEFNSGCPTTPSCNPVFNTGNPCSTYIGEK